MVVNIPRFSGYLFLSIALFCGTANTLTSPSDCGSVFLTVSSRQLGFNWFKRFPAQDDRVELNWDLSQCSEDSESIPNQIALFSEDPRVSNDSIPLTTIFINDHEYGFYVTDIRLGVISLPGGWKKKSRSKPKIIPTGPHCLPFWIASFKDGELLKTDCLKIQPTWMADIKENIEDLPLSRILIPGTHNAGSFEFAPSSMRDIFERFTLCQDTDMWTQLVFGIRYFDFRISYQASDDEKLWLSHGMVKVRPLMPLFRDIKRFLDSTTDEIVILDIHNLPAGFYQNNEIITARHEYLVEVLQEEFDEHILHYDDLMNSININVGPKVSDILSTGRRLIIGYPERNIINQNKWLWPAVTHKWGDKNDPHELKKYLDEVMEMVFRPTILWSAMAQMTPTPLDIVIGSTSLRIMADRVNRNLTQWVQYEWFNKANIVSSDFFLGNNLINLAVYYNDLKGRLMRTILGKLIYNHL